jgi:hypothetical protein
VTTNLDRAQLVSKSVQLQAIALKDAKVSSNLNIVDPTPELTLSQNYRASALVFEGTDDALMVFVELRFEARKKDEEPAAPIVELMATYTLAYRLPNARALPHDALQHFAELNGAYNVWPYWRELVQTVCGRVGIGSIVIPVFRPPVRELHPEEEEQLQISLQDQQAASV